MSVNLIFRSKLIGNSAKVGKDLVRAVATRKPQVYTPEFYDAIFPDFMKPVENDTRPLPDGTTELTLIGGLHTSSDDLENHYSVAAFDKDGKHLGSMHFYP